MNRQDLSNNIVRQQEINKNNIIELIAWIGSILLLSAYIGDFTRAVEFIMNTAGSAAVALVCIQKKANQPLLLNIFWFIGGFYKYFFTVS